MAVRCDKCGRTEHHDPACPEMFFGGDRSKPRGVPGAMPARAADESSSQPAARRQHAQTTSTDELDRIRPGFDPAAEDRRLADRNRRAADLRDLWWLIVRDAKGFEKARLTRAVRWARAGLGFDDSLGSGR